MSNANPLQLLRSNTANKRPDPTALADGRPAINTNAVSPGLFFKDSAGNLVKVGPVHVGTTAPNASPASGGATGNSLGEQWLDTTGGVYVLKIWDGSAWRSETGTFVDASGDTMTGALVMDNQQQVRFREVTANGTNYIALQAPASVASDKTITLPDVNGTVVTTGDTGTVTSTMIADATIVDADISASAEIAVSKLADGTARQLLQTDAAGTGVEWTSNVDVPGTLDVTGAATFDSTVAITGALTKSGSNVVTVGDTGTVTSTMILDGTIVNADVNASAAIAGTKISPDFGSQNVTTTGTNTAASFIPTSSTVPANGVYLPAANSVAISTGGSGRLFVDASGRVGVGTSAPQTQLHVNGGYDGSVTNRLTFSTTFDGNANSGSGIYFKNYYNNARITAFSNPASGQGGTLQLQTYNSDVSLNTGIVLDNAGRVGIGTTQLYGILTARAGTNCNFHIRTPSDVGSSGEGVAIDSLSDNAGGLRTLFMRATEHVFLGSSSERLRITSAGLVGIGTSSPSGRLTIANDSALNEIEFTGNDYTNVYSSTTQGFDIGISNGSSTGPLRLLTANTERLRITSAGLVGIGTSSPGAKLDVWPASSEAAFRGNSGVSVQVPAFELRGYNTNTTNGGLDIRTNLNGTFGDRVRITNDGLVGIGTASPNATLEIQNSSTPRIRIGDGVRHFEIHGGSSTQNVALGTAYNSGFDFFVNGFTNPRMTLDASGRLLVGTSSSIDSDSKLQIQDGYLNLYHNSSANGAGYGIRFSTNGGATGRTHGVIQLVQTAANGGTLVFSTTADGASSPTERMRIDNAGYVMIGATSFAGKGLSLQPNGGIISDYNGTATFTHFEIKNNNGTVGSIQSTGSSTAYNTSSDYRLKENVTQVTDGITRLQQLKPSRFNFIADPTKTVDGFLAHEVQAIVPEAITGEKDAVDNDGNPQYQGIDQSKLVPLLTAALQEAIAKIESLEARLTAAGI